MAEKVTDLLAGKTIATGNNANDGQPQEVDAKMTGINMEDPAALYCDAMTERDINKVADGGTITRVVLIGFEAYGKSTFASSMYIVLRCMKSIAVRPCSIVTPIPDLKGGC